jgi:hypothetical protein
MTSNCYKCGTTASSAAFVLKEYDVGVCSHHLAEMPIDTQAMAVPVKSDTKSDTTVKVVNPYPTGATAQDAGNLNPSVDFPPYGLNETDMTWLAGH